MRTPRNAHPLLARATCMATVFIVASACVISDKDRSAKAPDSASASTSATSPVQSLDTADISAPTYAVDSADTAGLSMRQTDSAQADPSFKRISAQTANADLTSFGGR